MHTRPTPRRPRNRRRTQRGAVMVETVLIIPVLLVVIVLIMYLGWQVRRLQRVTNMDRYEAWRQTTPGSVGPAQNPLNDHAALNNTFYDDVSDQARQLTHAANQGRTAAPEAYDYLQQQTTDETFAYLEDFLDASPTARYERFEARHNQTSPFLARYMSDLSRTRTGHRRLDGDWRYANGVTYDNAKGRWIPAGYRVSPAEPLRDVFFAEFDDRLRPYVRENRDGVPNLASRIRDFYSAYPSYTGPDIPLMR